MSAINLLSASECLPVIVRTCAYSTSFPSQGHDCGIPQLRFQYTSWRLGRWTVDCAVVLWLLKWQQKMEMNSRQRKKRELWKLVLLLVSWIAPAWCSADLPSCPVWPSPVQTDWCASKAASRRVSFSARVSRMPCSFRSNLAYANSLWEKNIVRSLKSTAKILDAFHLLDRGTTVHNLFFLSLQTCNLLFQYFILSPCKKKM